MLALMMIPGIICCFRQTSLTFFMTCYGIVLLAADIAAVIIFIISLIKKSDPESPGSASPKLYLLQIIAAVLILIQCIAPVVLQHTDTDDATYVALSAVAADTDTTLSFSPRSGSPIVIDKKTAINIRIVSPMHLYYASISKLTGVRPAVLCHTILPFFLTLMAYIFFYWIAKIIFDGERKKSLLFLIFLSIAHLFSGFSVYTSGTFMLVRIWQGKAQFAALIVPALILTYLYIYKTKLTLKNWFTILALLVAAAVMTPTGNFLSLICALLLAVTCSVFKKSPRVFLLTVPALLPNLAFLGFYALFLK